MKSLLGFHEIGIVGDNLIGDRILIEQHFYMFLLLLGKMGSSFKCFGAAPLENIIKSRKNLIMEDLENALAQQAPAIPHPNPDLHELPPLV